MATANYLSATDGASNHSVQQLLAGAFISITSANKATELQALPFTAADMLEASFNQAISQIQQFNAKIQSLTERQSELVVRFSTSSALAPTPAPASVYRRSLCVY